MLAVQKIVKLAHLMINFQGKTSSSKKVRGLKWWISAYKMTYFNFSLMIDDACIYAEVVSKNISVKMYEFALVVRSKRT